MLRKAGVIVNGNDGRIDLNPDHLTDGAKKFWWGRKAFLIDRDEVQIVFVKRDSDSVS